MAFNRIKKSVASRIAGSSSKTIPVRLYQWAQNHIETLSNSKSNTSSEDITPRSSSPELGAEVESSSSSLPMLELAFEATKINTGSCLKKAEQSHGQYRDRRRRRRPAKHVCFAYKDTLVTCMETGMRLIPPEEKTDQDYQAFFQRSSDKFAKRKAEKKARRLAREAANIARAEDSSSDEDSDEEELSFPADDEKEKEVIDPNDVEAKTLKDRIDAAERACEALTINTIACGGLDFALYVTRTKSMLDELEKTALYYRKIAKVASYRGEERRYARCGITAKTTLESNVYSDFNTAMSGHRAPVVPQKKAAAAAASAVVIVVPPPAIGGNKPEAEDKKPENKQPETSVVEVTAEVENK